MNDSLGRTEKASHLGCICACHMKFHVIRRAKTILTEQKEDGAKSKHL